MIQVLQILFSALVITGSAWLSKKHPQSAGYLIALPLATLLVLPFSYWQHQDSEASVKLAQEILWALPVSATFFIPFAFANKWGLNFWQAYWAGVGALLVSFLGMRFFNSSQIY